LGCLIISFGVYLQVKAKVIYLAGDGLVLAICTTFHKEFGKVKVGFDCTLVVIGIISSLVLLHSLHGIREGTIVAALLVGTTVRFYSKKLKFVDALLGDNVKREVSTHMDTILPQDDVVIAVTREFGSGGHKVGEMGADHSAGA
jgi:uncharacterized membrane protein YczE